VPNNKHYSAKYDANGDVILSFRDEMQEGSVSAHLHNAEEGEVLLFRKIESHVPPTLHAIPAAVSHVRFPNLWDAIPRFRSSRIHITAESLRFVGTFAAVFLFLFVSLNYQSYERMVRATLLGGEATSEQRALTAVTNPFLRKKLLSVPELPRAGVNRELFAIIPEVAPPDNRLIIPAININVPIVEASDAALRRRDFDMFDEDIQNALKFGVVHYPGTAEPGEVGNVFLTGHSSNLPWVDSNYNAVFALLPRLAIGDEYSVFYRGSLHRYRVTERFEVSPKDVSVLAQPNDQRMSTLMTCTPVGTTLRRLIIRAIEVDQETLANSDMPQI